MVPVNTDSVKSRVTNNGGEGGGVLKVSPSSDGDGTE